MQSPKQNFSRLKPTIQATVTLLFNFYAESIIRNAGLEEAQAGIKIAGRNINTLRYADDTTLMAESKEELESLLMKVKEERGKVGLKLNIQKTKIDSTPICQHPFPSSFSSIKSFLIIPTDLIIPPLKIPCMHASFSHF